MRYSEVSSRYAHALFDIAKETNNVQAIMADLRVVQNVFEKDKEIKNYISSQVVKPIEKQKALVATFNSVKIDESVKSFIYLLAQKGRINLFNEVISAFQATTDAAHGVTRGTVKAAQALEPDQQKAIEEKIAKVTGKKVILTYECDPSVIGGLIAEVGGYVFDDTITTHLKRLKDDIKRRTH